jgi:hypothetical protein
MAVGRTRSQAAVPDDCLIPVPDSLRNDMPSTLLERFAHQLLVECFWHSEGPGPTFAPSRLLIERHSGESIFQKLDVGGVSVTACVRRLGSGGLQFCA